MLKSLKTIEQLSTPLGLGYYGLKKVGQLAFWPFDSRGLGERLEQNHDRNSINTSLGELALRPSDDEVALLDARQILSITAYGMSHAEEPSAIPPAEGTQIVKGLMREHFPDRRFDDFPLPENTIASLRSHVPEY